MTLKTDKEFRLDEKIEDLNKDEEFIKKLNKIAMRIYGRHYGELCGGRQGTIISLYNTGDF